MGRFWKILFGIFVLVLLDQFTKGLVQANFNLHESLPIIPNFFSLTYIRNTGAAFGMGANEAPWIRGILFLFLPCVACLWLSYLLIKIRNKNLLLAISYALILAGAVGNLIDRFYLGYVVDFLDFYYQNHHFPAFNVADSSITVAAFLLIIDFIREYKKTKVQAKDNVSDPL